MNEDIGTLTDRLLSLHLAYHPVDATFMGISGYDRLLPPADAEVGARERASLLDLELLIRQVPDSPAPADRMDRRLLTAQLRHGLRELETRPRYRNPMWYTGEAAFAVISLLLPTTRPRPLAELQAALKERIAGIPDFLANGRKHLADVAIPADWVMGARLEADALVRLLQRGLRRHPAWFPDLEVVCKPAEEEARRFGGSLAGHPSADPSCGEEYLAFLMQEVHGLPYSPEEADELASEGFERAKRELEAMAKELDRTRGWREQLAELEADHPPEDRILQTYEEWNAMALERARGLLSPALEYGLTFQWLPEWASEIAGDLYFLFYRSPSPERAGDGSVYWVFPSGPDKATYLRTQNTAAIKSVHVVHHGSIGHHTQNASARRAPSRLARLAGTDCANGIAFLLGGTLVEGWACYAQGLMAEADGFYTPLELLSLKQSEMRNAAFCLGDIRLHSGRWSLEGVQAFYRDELGYSPARLWNSTLRNSLYPGTRLMYWLGTQAIRQMRSKWVGDVSRFHDLLLSHGAMPVQWIADEMDPDV